jgi:hypothetical protein
MPAWWRWGNLDTILPDHIDDFVNHEIGKFTGYKNNDAICWISSLLSINWFGWLNSGYAYPAIEIEVTGEGTIELALLSFPLGSRAIIEVDEKSNLLDIITGGLIDSSAVVVDTARDVLSVPPEGEPLVRVQIDVVGEGDHTIYIQFSPVIDFELSEDLIGFGGGLRSVELCGGLRPRNMPPPPPPPPLEGVTELRPEFQFTVDCGLEYRLRDQENNIVQDWQSVAGWDDNAALCFTPLGGGMATVEEICEGVTCAIEKAAQSILAGGLLTATEDITIKADKSITVAPSGAIVDDPLTTIDEERRSGGASRIYQGVKALFEDIHGWYDDGIGDVETVLRVGSKYSVNGDMATAITFYFGVLAAPPVGFSRPVITSLLTPYLYCKGLNRASIATYAIETFNTQVESMLLIINGLTQEQINAWYATGSQVLSTEYITFGCVPVPDDSFILPTPNTTSSVVSGTIANKLGHRLLFEASGKVFNPAADGAYVDFLYNVSNTGVATLAGNTGALSSFFGVVNKPTALEVPFEPSGIYRFTRDTVGTGIMNLQRRSTWVGTTGDILVSVKDLGEIQS